MEIILTFIALMTATQEEYRHEFYEPLVGRTRELTAEWVTLLDLLALLHAHLNNHARHGRSYGSRVRRSLLARDGVNRGVVVVHRDGPNLETNREARVLMITRRRA